MMKPLARFSFPVLWGLVLLLLLSPALPARAADEDTALVYGFDAMPDEEYVHYYGLAVGMDLGPSWSWGNGWSLATGVSLNGGLLHAGGEDGFIATAGPRIQLNLPGDRVTFFGSVRAGGLSEQEYGDMDLGGWFTFAENLGVRLNLGKGFSAGYAFEHISNANIYDENPGINLHTFIVGFTF